MFPLLFSWAKSLLVFLTILLFFFTQLKISLKVYCFFLLLAIFINFFFNFFALVLFFFFISSNVYTGFYNNFAISQVASSRFRVQFLRVLHNRFSGEKFCSAIIVRTLGLLYSERTHIPPYSELVARTMLVWLPINDITHSLFA